jgi:hypothetical protein
MLVNNRLLRILGIVLGVVIVLTGFYGRQSFEHIKSLGVTTIADPIQEYRIKKSTYSANITFTTKNGEKIAKNDVYFPESVAHDFESNTPVVIYYNPQSPEDFVFEKDEAGWIVVLLGVFMIFAACVPLIGNIRVK